MTTIHLHFLKDSDEEAFREYLEKLADDDLRARYRPLLALFYGSPPAWLQTFVDGGPLVLPSEEKTDG